MQIDVFNGDADGICALIQLRLAEPADAKLVTGVKRDIQLLERLTVTDQDRITVLDISLEKNRQALERMLQIGASVFYVDHHHSGRVPEHPNLHAIINTDANICTSLLVNHFLQERYVAWAVTAAFGDNLSKSAVQAALSLSLPAAQLKQLRDLGVLINYNAYGESISDLHIAPDDLYRELAGYGTPFDFLAGHPVSYEKMQAGFLNDMANAEQIKPEYSSAAGAVYILPDAAWSRRVSGVFGNELANRFPARAHAVISCNAQNGFQISVRAPLSHPTGADELCSSFPTGGGRKGAAGINHLPIDRLAAFISAFDAQYR